MFQSRMLQVPVWLVAIGEFRQSLDASSSDNSSIAVVMKRHRRSEVGMVRRRSHDTPSIRLNGVIKVINCHRAI